MNPLPVLLMFGLAFASAAAIAVTAGGLPDVVATHFAASGRANGWMTRDGYVSLMAALAVGMPLLTWLGAGFLPRRLPRFVNLPARDFWLAPERREDTLAAIERFGALVGMLTAAFIVSIHAAIVVAHRSSPPNLSGTHVAWLLATFGAAVAALAAGYALRFRAPRGRHAA